MRFKLQLWLLPFLIRGGANIPGVSSNATLISFKRRYNGPQTEWHWSNNFASLVIQSHPLACLRREINTQTGRSVKLPFAWNLFQHFEKKKLNLLNSSWSAGLNCWNNSSNHNLELTLKSPGSVRSHTASFQWWRIQFLARQFTGFYLMEWKLVLRQGRGRQGLDDEWKTLTFSAANYAVCHFGERKKKSMILSWLKWLFAVLIHIKTLVMDGKVYTTCTVLPIITAAVKFMDIMWNIFWKYEPSQTFLTWIQRIKWETM